MELRRVVGALTATIAVGTLASSGSLVLITSYLHRLASQIDDNLQSVRAVEEIQVQLLWHARNTNQAVLLASPELAAAATESQAAIYDWYFEARRYVGSPREQALVDRLEREIESYFAEHASLDAAGLSGADRFAEAAAPFRAVYDAANELLQVNVEQAAAATERGRRWDAIASVIGLSVAAIFLALMTAVIVGARATVYRPLLALRDGMRRYAGRDYSTRVEERGVGEIREIARSFNEMAGALQRQREGQLEFIVAVAHDLRNPLAAMKAAVEVLASKSPSSDEHHEDLIRMMSRQTDQLVRMISDLIDAARVEAGRFSIAPTSCDARDLAAQTVELFGRTSSLHDVRLEVPDTPLPVQCDPLRICQVLNNLVGNAIKYSPQGGEVTVTARRVDDDVAIEIADQGPGIAPQERELIFEPFRRGENVDASIPGAGIGLSVARRIVEAHGGRLELDSTVGRGSTFRVSLPAMPAARPAERGNLADHKRSGSP